MKSKILLISMCAFLTFTNSVWGISCPDPAGLKGYGADGSTPTVDGWEFAQWWRGFKPTKESTFVISSTFLYDPGKSSSAWCNYYESLWSRKGFALRLPLQENLNSTTAAFTGGSIHYSAAEKGCKCEGGGCQIVPRLKPIAVEDLVKPGACMAIESKKK